MITSQQFLNAVADFEGLIIDGLESDDAIIKAAESNGIDSSVLEYRLTSAISIDDRVEKIRRERDYGRFLDYAKIEVDNCKKNPRQHTKSIFDTEGTVEVISARLQEILSRPLTEHKIWKIGQMLNPVGTHLRMTKFKDPEMTKILLRRELDC